MNGQQLYGIERWFTVLKMSKHQALARLSLKQRLALYYVVKESKLTRLAGRVFSNTFTPFYPSRAYDQFLDKVVKTASGTPSPVITNIAVTARCSCRCWHCSFSDRNRRDGLQIEDFKRIIPQLQELGVSVIGLTGGEPLLRDDLEDIIGLIDDRSMPILFTTGWGLTRARVRRLKDAGLVIPVLSLDHHTAERHDAGRRRAGTFAETLKAIELFQSEGFYVAVSFVPTKKLVADKDDLYRTMDFFRDLGINDLRLTSPILSGRLTARPDEKLSQEDIETIIGLQKKCLATQGYPNVFAYDFFESRQYYGCQAGYTYMFIDSQGNVSPCDFTMLTFGNVASRNIADVWNEMSRVFCGPSCSCYANVIHEQILEKNLESFPVPETITQEIVSAQPPFCADDIPLYYKKMGFKA
jgi:MoaA/NifB/PqqE/SkfB family radical SAM enzyme